VKLSEVTTAAIRAVEKMSQAAKEHTGVEFSTEQKTEMVDAMIS
jgi:hypothetical protein